MNVHEAKTKLSKLLALVEKGEEVVIARNGRPIARLVRADERPDRRVPGLDKGRIWYADDLEAPLPDSIAREFEK
ncbi:MAG: type II toxin-antitoxin system Phd/YefM family antitoxin [Myxococcota bacterium]